MTATLPFAPPTPPREPGKPSPSKLAKLARKKWFPPGLQGKSERARRLRQIRLGHVNDSSVTEDARYAAHGLVRPTGAIVNPSGR